MHSVVKESLEEYLAGALNPVALREIEAHLNGCRSCGEQVRAMQAVGRLFSSLSCAEELTPAPGFYARVVRQVEARPSTPTFASLFALDLAFGRRLVFSSLLTLALLGGYLVSRETDYAATRSPEAAIAGIDRISPDGDNRDHMLVTLTTYEP